MGNNCCAGAANLNQYDWKDHESAAPSKEKDREKVLDIAIKNSTGLTTNLDHSGMDNGQSIIAPITPSHSEGFNSKIKINTDKRLFVLAPISARRRGSRIKKPS